MFLVVLQIVALLKNDFVKFIFHEIYECTEKQNPNFQIIKFNIEFCRICAWKREKSTLGANIWWYGGGVIRYDCIVWLFLAVMPCPPVLSCPVLSLLASPSLQQPAASG